jgi:hypothetical protein
MPGRLLGPRISNSEGDDARVRLQDAVIRAPVAKSPYVAVAAVAVPVSPFVAPASTLSLFRNGSID